MCRLTRLSVIHISYSDAKFAIFIKCKRTLEIVLLVAI